MTTFRSLGDLSSTFLFSRQTNALKTDVQRHSTELATGKTTDISQTLRGDYRAVASIERRMGLAQAEKLAIAEAKGFATAAQAAMDVVKERSDAAMGVLLAIPHAPTDPTLERAGRSVRESFETVVTVLNQKNGDRAIFAGDATDGAALASVDTIMADLEALVATETTAAGVIAAVDAWFDTPGGGFETVAYTGSDTSLAPFRLGDGDTTSFPVTAANEDLRAAMKGLAMGTLLDGPTLAGDTTERLALSRAASQQAINASSLVVNVQATVGEAEAAIEAADVRASAEATSLEIARSALIGVDSFEAATKLEAAQTQLETLFALTARVSRLSLVDFLR